MIPLHCLPRCRQAAAATAKLLKFSIILSMKRMDGEGGGGVQAQVTHNFCFLGWEGGNPTLKPNSTNPAQTPPPKIDFFGGGVGQDSR